MNERRRDKRGKATPPVRIRNRIVVGLDGSTGARQALRWAVREAVRRHCPVLVVTAWPAGAHVSHDEAGHAELLARHMGLTAMQRQAVADGVAELPPGHRPVVAREIILTDPVNALVHAARQADLLVLGSDPGHGLAETSVAGRVARRFAGHGTGPCPLVVVPAPTSAGTDPIPEDSADSPPTTCGSMLAP